MKIFLNGVFCTFHCDHRQTLFDSYINNPNTSHNHPSGVRPSYHACSVPDAQSAPRQRGLAPRRALLRTGGDLDHLALAPNVLGRALLRDGVRHVVAPADLQPAPHQRVELGGGVALPIAHPVDLARPEQLGLKG